MLSTRILFFYILREQLKVFVVAVLGITLVMNFGAVVVFLQQQYPLPFGSLLKILPYRTPILFPWIFPLAMLMSTTLTYGRLTSDNELLAIQMAGMHLIRPIIPAVLLGLVVMGSLVAVNDQLLPWCRQREYEIYVQESERVLIEVFRTKKTMRGGGFKLTWTDYRGRTLYNVTVRQREGDRQIAEYRAESASFHTDGDNLTLTLTGISGEQFREGADFRLDRHVERIPLEGVFTHAPKYKALTTVELLQVIDRKYRPDLPLPADPKLAAVARDYRVRCTRNIMLRIHRRFSLAFSALVFTLVGVSLGILARQAHMLSAFFLGCLPVMLLYYPVFLLGHSMAGQGTISAAAACWTPAGVLGGIGLGLLGWLFVR